MPCIRPCLVKRLKMIIGKDTISDDAKDAFNVPLLFVYLFRLMYTGSETKTQNIIVNYVSTECNLFVDSLETSYVW